MNEEYVDAELYRNLAIKNRELEKENRQLRLNLADEQDCNNHAECRAKIKDLEAQLEDCLRNG